MSLLQNAVDFRAFRDLVADEDVQHLFEDWVKSHVGYLNAALEDGHPGCVNTVQEWDLSPTSEEPSAARGWQVAVRHAEKVFLASDASSPFYTAVKRRLETARKLYDRLGRGQ